MNGKLWLYVGDKSAWRGVGAAGCLALDSVCDADLPGRVIGRDMVAFPDHIDLWSAEESCYSLGQIYADAMFARHPKRLWARMGPNEQHPADAATARRWGAFEGGVASVVWAHGEAYIAGNWSVGTPEAAIFCAWLQAFVLWAKPGNREWLVGYHGYTDGATDAYWLEQRPWTIWKPCLEARGMRLPRMIMTEAGFDAGPVENNGYRDRIGSEAYARYLAALPALVPECEAFCIYLCGTIDPAKWASFDIAGDEVVLAAVADANRKESPMAWDRERVWNAYANQLAQVPAFEKYRASHPELGDWIDDAEYDRGGLRLRGAAGGLVFARIGDWGNVRHATKVEALPKA